MPKTKELIKFHPVKDYIRDTFKMRSSKSAIDKFIEEVNPFLETVLKEASEFAKEDKRRTVMDQDIISALEKNIGKKHLTWQETSEEIIRQNPTDLSKITKAINNHIAEHQEK